MPGDSDHLHSAGRRLHAMSKHAFAPPFPDPQEFPKRHMHSASAWVERSIAHIGPSRPVHGKRWVLHVGRMLLAHGSWNHSNSTLPAGRLNLFHRSCICTCADCMLRLRKCMCRAGHAVHRCTNKLNRFSLVRCVIVCFKLIEG
jgi:hypothetical protein